MAKKKNGSALFESISKERSGPSGLQMPNWMQKDRPQAAPTAGASDSAPPMPLSDSSPRTSLSGGAVLVILC